MFRSSARRGTRSRVRWPLANLVLAALEPDSQNGYVANRIIDGVASLARVMARPDMKRAGVP